LVKSTLNLQEILRSSNRLIIVINSLVDVVFLDGCHCIDSAAAAAAAAADAAAAAAAELGSQLLQQRPTVLDLILHIIYLGL